MFYRRKSYIVVNEFVEHLNAHFLETNLPNQLKHGARLIGRWMTPKDSATTEVFAIWEYDSVESYEAIEANVRSDTEHLKRIREWYEKFGGREEVFNKYLVDMKNEPLISTL